jgi:tetratricopeptide (TPR) repeat protein
MALGLALWLAALPARAAVTVLGHGPGNTCYLAARFNLNPMAGIAACNQALLAPLSLADRAGTHVNRGALEAALGNEDKALADFNTAIAENPRLGDGYLNRGAMLVNRKQYQEARADILRGIALGPSMPEVGYYDLGIVEQRLGHDKDAFAAFQKSLSLAPYFQPAIHALEGFVVEPPPPPMPA